MSNGALKTCRRCGAEKTRRACFTRNASCRDGYHSWCKACVKRYNRVWRHENAGYISALGKATYQLSRERAQREKTNRG